MDYQQLISIENLFQAFDEFKKGKRKRIDVQSFEKNLEDNLFSLQADLIRKSYKHGGYKSFFVYDPKLRHIHKAGIRDRVVHHLLYKYLYDQFDKSFIFDSYSCRLSKGTHNAVKRLEKLSRIVSKNYNGECWALKLDVKKFFASVDHQVLIDLLGKRIKDQEVLRLLREVIKSFCTQGGVDKGIPLGNLTSQIFANIYLNELDQFIKHQLKIKYYLRYADDFLILSPNKDDLNQSINLIGAFLKTKLKLELHPNKIILRKLDWGIDFLGYVVLPNYILPRAKTRRRAFKKLKSKIYNPSFEQSLQSYLGYFSHANSYKIVERLFDQL
jgi:RNA-directed DNA polymerase